MSKALNRIVFSLFVTTLWILQSSCDKLVILNVDLIKPPVVINYPQGSGEDGIVFTELYRLGINPDSIFRANRIDRGQVDELRLLNFSVRLDNPVGINLNNFKSFRVFAGFIDEEDDRVVIADKIVEPGQTFVEFEIKDFSLMNFVKINQPSAIFLDAETYGAFASTTTILVESKYQVRVSGQSRR